MSLYVCEKCRQGFALFNGIFLRNRSFRTLGDFTVKKQTNKQKQKNKKRKFGQVNQYLTEN